MEGVFEWEGKPGWPSGYSQLKPHENLFYLMNQDKIASTLSHLNPKKVKDMDLIRVGGERDGGYLMLKPLLPKGKVAYSLGVGKTSKWEDQIKDYGYDIHMYDHTVNGAPVQHPQLHFHKTGIGPKNQGPLKTIETIIEDNGHSNETDMLLQCDIEGAEWESFAWTPQKTLGQFSQIILEMHWFLHYCSDPNRLNLIHKTLSNLSQNFTPYHIHSNNYVGLFGVKGKVMAEVIEVSYVRNDLVEFTNEKLVFPTPLDKPNSKGNKPDVILGEFGW